MVGTKNFRSGLLSAFVRRRCLLGFCSPAAHDVSGYQPDDGADWPNREYGGHAGFDGAVEAVAGKKCDGPIAGEGKDRIADQKTKQCPKYATHGCRPFPTYETQTRMSVSRRSTHPTL